MSLNSRVFLYQSFLVVCLAAEQWLWVVNESFTLDTWFTLFDELYNSLIIIIKINYGEPPGKTAQPQDYMALVLAD